MDKNSPTFFQIIRKSLIILIIILMLNSFITSLYLSMSNPAANGNLMDWLTYGLDALVDIVSIYFLNRDNIIGDVIAFYQNFSGLEFEYQIGGYYGINIFLSSPQSMFTDIASLFAIILILIHVSFIVLRKNRSQLFSSQQSSIANQAFLVKYRLDFILISFFVALIIFYWGFWGVLSR